MKSYPFPNEVVGSSIPTKKPSLYLRVLEQDIANRLKFTLDCPTLVFFFFFLTLLLQILFVLFCWDTYFEDTFPHITPTQYVN